MTTLDPETEQFAQLCESAGRAFDGFSTGKRLRAAAAYMRKLATDRADAIGGAQKEKGARIEALRELTAALAELERLREAVRWLNSSSWWRPWHESLGKDPAAALIRLHERVKP